MAPGPLRIATRGSPMALYQAGLVRDRLIAANPELAAEGGVALLPLRTTGDRVQDRPLAEIGGKGLFAKEIEEALLDGRADLAVHSMKDMETVLPAGLMIGAVPRRDDPRDVLVTHDGTGLAALPPGARIATGSLRRRAQLLRRRGDLDVVPIRGNVDTRLRRVAAGDADGLVVALCGLDRLGRAGVACEVLAPEVMLPAVGQGALAIECREDATAVRRLLAPLDDAASAACAAAERAMLAALDGSCRTPIAGLATIAAGRLTLRGLLLTPDGDDERRGEIAGPVAEAARLGAELGARLRAAAGPEFRLA